jgi:hypothetical protein
MKKLFLDDVRIAPDKTWHVVKNYKQFIDYIEVYGLPDVISFDHDLGDEILTGYDCAKYLIKHILDNEYKINNINFIVHSMNPVGKENIEKLLNNFNVFLRGIYE